jgi:hypothetical protein
MAWLGRALRWAGLVVVVLLCAFSMLKLLHPPASNDVALARLALATPESGECAAWDNVAIKAEHMSRSELRKVCPDLPLSDPESDGN